MTTNDSLCIFLDWDTQFFHRRIGRITLETLNQDAIQNIDQWAKEHQLDCLYYLAPITDMVSIRLAEEYRFHLVDVRLTFSLNLSRDSLPTRTDLPANIRRHLPTDLPELKEIAGNSFQTSRFYNDQHFPRSLCDALYEKWIENSCSGYADIVLVATDKNVPAGFITCKMDTSRMDGEIGLVGVRSDLRNQGFGGLLLSGALAWFQKQEAKSVSVVTQGGNMGALRLYQKFGFTVHSIQVWYHKWYSREKA